MIPYDLPSEIVEEYRRILILTRHQYDEVLRFLQDKEMWKRQVEWSKKPCGGHAFTLQMNTIHYQSGKDCTLTLRSDLATINILGAQKPAPWTECNGAVFVKGWARIKKIPELEEIPHIFLSLMDNNYIVGMNCGRIVLICEDPIAPTLVDLGLCKSNKEIEEEKERRREEKERRREEKERRREEKERRRDYIRKIKQEEACVRAAQKLERGKR